MYFFLILQEQHGLIYGSYNSIKFNYFGLLNSDSESDRELTWEEKGRKIEGNNDGEYVIYECGNS